MHRLQILLLAVITLGPLSEAAQADAQASKAEVVRALVDAFNQQDVDAMTARLTEDVQWLSVNGTTVTVEIEGRSALATWMEGYFAACSSCRSEVISMVSSNNRVSVVEVASWIGSDGPQSQQAMAVYEFKGSLITRIYYFPEETLSDVASPTGT